ncbi:hypothetical protein IWX46DRAFT_273420 [Phyllosticta citricarpa]|uniref:Uncharacterized protein n=1 Tax=Phyllosticta citricarpa TaxID=55181 RepID=A0ABR1LKI1_9PEZI
MLPGTVYSSALRSSNTQVLPSTNASWLPHIMDCGCARKLPPFPPSPSDMTSSSPLTIDPRLSVVHTVSHPPTNPFIHASPLHLICPSLVPLVNCTEETPQAVVRSSVRREHSCAGHVPLRRRNLKWREEGNLGVWYVCIWAAWHGKARLIHMHTTTTSTTTTTTTAARARNARLPPQYFSVCMYAPCSHFAFHLSAFHKEGRKEGKECDATRR